MATWYKVTSWSEKLEPREVVRETAKMLVFSDGRKSMVETGWFHWFPTEAEALAAIAKRKARDAEQVNRRRLNEVAPDLLSVLMRLEPYLDAIVCYASTQGEHEPNRLAVDARAAISRALPGGEGK